MSSRNVRISLETLEHLQARLREAEETLDAIRTGEVDALVVHGSSGDHVFSLQGAEQPYRIFVEHMQQGAITLTPNGTILYANQFLASLLDTPLQRLIGASFYDLLATEPPSQRQAVEGMVARPGDARGDAFLRRHDGTSLAVHLALHEMSMSNDTQAIGVVVTDLTERHERQRLAQALEELRLQEEQLRHRNEALLLARTQLENASRAKDQFLASLSHELRTPLTPVLLSVAAMAADPAVPDDLRREFSVMRRNIELEARLIDDLLDLTRIAKGKLEIHTQPSDAHQILRDALETCQADIRAKHLAIHSLFEADHANVQADPIRLQQVFWNLLRNAVKFTPDRGNITIRTHNAPLPTVNRGAAHPALVVEIEDTGIGLAADALPRLFNAFEQVNPAITRQFGGLGLGLSISKTLVDLHHGQIRADSTGPGTGATFTVTLPTITVPAIPSVPSPVVTTLPITRLRILLVEDHDDTRRNMARLLSALKYEVQAASTAADALVLAASHHFDLMISDIGLPDQSGLDLMQQLRRLYNLKGICLSGFGMDSDVAKAYEAGFSEHLTKPVNFQRLEQAIRNVALAQVLPA